MPGVPTPVRAPQPIFAIVAAAARLASLVERLEAFDAELVSLCRSRAGAIRRLTLVRPAPGAELRDVPFWWDGAPYEPGLVELDWLMRDVQAKQVRPIDVRLFYLSAMVQAEFGARPILVTSGFRTRATNERLRAQGIDAARNYSISAVEQSTFRYQAWLPLGWRNSSRCSHWVASVCTPGSST